LYIKQKTYGLIGKSLRHSFSPGYFKNKFEKEGIENCTYRAFELENIGQFPKLIEDEKGISGLNVTIPYKESILPFLDELSDDACQIGAVNTIKFKNGQTIGHNTDVIGFEKSLQPLLKNHHTHSLILGTGGAAKAVEFVMKKQNIEFKYVSRSKAGNALSYKDLTKEILDEHTLIINTTPLGMYPDIDAYPDIPFEYIGQKHLVYDLIYNPAETRLMTLAKEKGATVKNGLEMLEIQAEESWKIWNS
jgi:shikimate dehydrogenase